MTGRRVDKGAKYGVYADAIKQCSRVTKESLSNEFRYVWPRTPKEPLPPKKKTKKTKKKQQQERPLSSSAGVVRTRAAFRTTWRSASEAKRRSERIHAAKEERELLLGL
jgi:hypothetical protein